MPAGVGTAGVAALVTALGAGTLAADAPGAGVARLVPELALGLVAVTAGLALGKKVACLPLWICHASQSITRENARTAQSMERRISFMRESFLEKLMG